MKVWLMVIGAHNGAKIAQDVREKAAKGPVVLVEPVPFLFEKLQARFADLENVIYVRRCVSVERRTVRFFAPRPSASDVVDFGDQLGSLIADHATRHSIELGGHVEPLDLEAVTISDLLKEYNIEQIVNLVIDTEGYDAALLAKFPFDQVMPKAILFEYKHADGFLNIGRNMGQALIALDDAGYDVKVVSKENCWAVLRPRTKPP